MFFYVWRCNIHLCRRLSIRRNVFALQFDIAVYDNRFQTTMHRSLIRAYFNIIHLWIINQFSVYCFHYFNCIIWFYR
jgi:hypothetical protein